MYAKNNKITAFSTLFVKKNISLVIAVTGKLFLKGVVCHKRANLEPCHFEKREIRLFYILSD